MRPIRGTAATAGEPAIIRADMSMTVSDTTMRLIRCVTVLLLVPAVLAGADEGDAWRQRTADSVERGLKFLVSAQQPDGGWLVRGRSDPAITALVVKCFVQHPGTGADHPLVGRAIDFMLTFVQPDGGIYVPGQGLRNYQTSICLMALSATKDQKHARSVERAQAFLKKGQWDEDEGHERNSVWYGGAGYGQHKRPDLSNTQMMLEALQQSGLPADDPVFQKALVFVSRSQMSSGSNDQLFARGAIDGGFIYTPVNDGESKAGTVTIEGRPRLRTYGSMTYSGFKSLLYAAVDGEDPRVKAALEWIKRHYTLDENPNMPGAQSHEGLYYYYHVFARALNAWGREVITDARGRKHYWRSELCEKLIGLQLPDGSWVNQKDRWYEGNPYLVTSYSILAMQTALR